MLKSRRIDLHCHSIFSDGTQTPEALAEILASAGVRYAALTDHDTIGGQKRFKDALQRVNIGFIPGVEITTYHNGQKVDLLGYGFDLENRELNLLLDSVRQAQAVEIQSVTHSLRKAGNSSSHKFNGRIELAEAIKTLQLAGGKTFLAHPLQFIPEISRLESAVKEFKTLGLDGIEAWYGPYSDQERMELADLAHRLGLLVSGGTDFHNLNSGNIALNAVELPSSDWINFRDAILVGSSEVSNQHRELQSHENTNAITRPPYRVHHRYLVLRIIIPVLFTIVLFISALWGLILPAFEQSLLDRKREMISELTNAAWSILATFEQNEREGVLTREQAQEQAIAQIRALRYGEEGKDYFWLQDLTPTIIMHPYRTDLIGEDVSEFQDPNGVRIFVEFANLVKQKNEGYVKYVWQWKDNPDRIEAKESFIKGFEPWGWIIGTGLYIEDVQQEIARIETRVVNISLVITGVLVMLLLFIAFQGILVENKRLAAEKGQRESTEKFRSLVEATTEGVLMVLGSRCRYANPTLMNILDLSNAQLELLDLEDVLPHIDENKIAWDAVNNLSNETAFEGLLTHSSGRLVECALTISPIVAEGFSGHVFTIKPIANTLQSSNSGGEQLWKLGEVVQTIGVGIFRAKPSRRGTFSELNSCGAELIRSLIQSEISQPGLEDLFSEHTEYEQFIEDLNRTQGFVTRRVKLVSKEHLLSTIEIQARLTHDEEDEPAWITGTLIDFSSYAQSLAEKEDQYKIMESRLAFFQQPLSNYENHLLTCPVDTPIQKTAALMNSNNATAVLITAPDGSALGIVTDRDIRQRCLARGLTSSAPIHEIMSAPVIRISQDALVYEALMLMEENDIKHLAIENKDGKIENIIESNQLIRFHHYGMSILGPEIAQSGSTEEIARKTRLIPQLINTMLESTSDPQRTSQMLSSLADAATSRLIELAISELGEPPCEFSFIAVGSQGREEQSLASDQDNAILFENMKSEQEQSLAASYFEKLGSFVCGGLDQAGYPYCQGQIMANNPKWVRPLNSWKAIFYHWITVAEPKELLDFCIFFDLRCVYGSDTLCGQLQDSIRTNLKDQPDLLCPSRPEYAFQ